MLKCEKCGRQTEPGETTGKRIYYVRKEYENGRVGKEAINEKKTCHACSGSKFIKEEK